MEREWMVLYDGYCKLCSRTVQWIIRNDPGKRFSFTALQEAELRAFDQPGGDTVLLMMNGKVHNRSGAALRIALRLRFPWPLLGIFLLVPPFLRNGVYHLVARNRKRWFGTRTTCFLP